MIIIWFYGPEHLYKTIFCFYMFLIWDICLSHLGIGLLLKNRAPGHTKSQSSGAVHSYSKKMLLSTIDPMPLLCS